jgi:hypothetical protein
MKIKIFLSLVFILLLSHFAKAQQMATITIGKYDTLKVATTNYNGETMPWVVLNEVVVTDRRIFKTPLDKAKFNRLRYNVLKVLPYARYAGQRYRQLERDLALTNDSKTQKQLVKACEKEIKNLFNSKIKDMTINQGEILIKLIDRETGTSSYKLVKEIQGTLPAFFMQSLARIFGHNLKAEYDAEEERDIETIITQAGYYTYQ